MLHRHPITGESFGLEALRRERDKRTVVAGIHSVLSLRLREGYTIKSVCFKKGRCLFVVVICKKEVDGEHHKICMKSEN